MLIKVHAGLTELMCLRTVASASTAVIILGQYLLMVQIPSPVSTEHDTTQYYLYHNTTPSIFARKQIVLRSITTVVEFGKHATLNKIKLRCFGIVLHNIVEVEFNNHLGRKYLLYFIYLSLSR